MNIIDFNDFVIIIRILQDLTVDLEQKQIKHKNMTRRYFNKINNSKLVACKKSYTIGVYFFLDHVLKCKVIIIIYKLFSKI